MTSINEEINHSEEHHHSIIDVISKAIRKMALKKEEITKPFQSSDEIEDSRQQHGFILLHCNYYISTVDANRYCVKYKTLLTKDKFAPLEYIVEFYEVRPSPPNLPEKNVRKRIYFV